MESLFQLTGEQANIEALLEETGGELTPEIEEALKAVIAAIAAKVDAYTTLVRKFKSQSDVLAAEIKRLQALKKTADNSEKSLKEYLQYAMEQNGYDKLEGQYCKVSLAKSPVSTEVDEELIEAPYRQLIQDLQSKLPVWLKLSTSIDKTALKAEYYGKDLMPAGLYFDDTKKSIRIK